MIRSKTDYYYYLEQDRIALGIKKRSTILMIKEVLFPDLIYQFQRKMRRLEYYKNSRKDILGKFYCALLMISYRKLSLRLGFSIPLNVFGPGLAIVHYGTIVVNANARVGANCRIHPSTCIGASGGIEKAPQIGDNVYIAPGVKIYGDIRIANNIATAANAAVSNSFEEENILIGGVPAKKIKSFDITTLIKHLQ